MREGRRFLRDFEAGQQLDLLLIAAVSAVLVIRFSLALAGYPQLGGTNLHVAHMLWGGLLMLASIVLLLSFVGRGQHRLAALLGGLGFGAFIDEVGKFLTHDNDYFYKPAVAVIYVVFVLIYLAVRSLHGERAASRNEYLANALLEFQEIAAGDLESSERTRALRYLDGYGRDRPPAPQLAAILGAAHLVPDRRPDPLARLSHRLVAAYRTLATSRWFERGLVAFFVLQFLARVLRLVALLAPLPRLGERLLTVPFFNPGAGAGDLLGPLQWLLLGSNVLAGVLLALGVAAVLLGRRAAGLRMFQRSVLVTIFLVQVFVFYQVEWLGLGELAFHLLVFFALGFMIRQERS